MSLPPPVVESLKGASLELAMQVPDGEGAFRDLTGFVVTAQPYQVAAGLTPGLPAGGVIAGAPLVADPTFALVVITNARSTELGLGQFLVDVDATSGVYSHKARLLLRLV